MSGKETHAEKIGRFVADLRYDDLPASTVKTVKRLVIDTLGCAFGALGSEPSRIIGGLVPTISDGPSATLIGETRRSSAAGAIFLNGALVRYLDFMDVYWSKDICHPSENIPLAMACVEEADGSGRDLIEAIVAGYEIQMRLCDAFLLPSIGMHHVSAAGYVAPLVAGKIAGQTAQQLAHGCVLGGVRHMTMHVLAKGKLSMAKAIGYGLSSSECLTAAQLAGAGFTGPLNAIDWMFDLAKPEQPVEMDFDTDRWRIDGISLKQYPVQYALQAPVEAAIQLHRELGGRITDVARVISSVKAKTLMQAADPTKFKPENRETADHSLPACVAMALADGELTIHQFARGRFKDADVVALLDKSEAVLSEAFERDYPNGRPGAVEVVLNDGTRLSASQSVPYGDASRPMGDAAIEAKFRSMAEPHIGASGADGVLAAVDALETLPDLGRLVRALTPH